MQHRISFLVGCLTPAALIGCNTMSNISLFESGYVFHDSDRNIFGIVAKNGQDELIYVYFNRELGEHRDDLVLLEKRKGNNYDLFVSGIGGIEIGEIKKIPIFDGWCTLAEDSKIYCSERISESKIPDFYEFSPGSPDYETRKVSLDLRKVGDTTLLRGGQPLPRQGI